MMQQISEYVCTLYISKMWYFTYLYPSYLLLCQNTHPGTWAQVEEHHIMAFPQIAKLMGPTWGPPVSCRPQMGPMLDPRTLLSGSLCTCDLICINFGADGFHWLNLQTRNCLPYKLWLYLGHHIGVPGIYSVYRSQTISRHGLTLIAAWISNCTSSKVWYDITYPFRIFQGEV